MYIRIMTRSAGCWEW